MTGYWVVGATWGRNDKLNEFLRRGYWLLGWDKDEQPAQAKRRDQIRPGDRIAIKRMLGKGSSFIEILALGIVKEVDAEDGCVYVNWLVKKLNRRVPAKGCLQSIHGPFVQGADWTRTVFSL